MKNRFSLSAGAVRQAEEPARGPKGGGGPERAVPSVLHVSPDGPAASAVVAFLKIEKAPRLLASLASRIPSDVIPMPIQRLSGFCRQSQGRPVAFSGVVVCVPERTLPEEDAGILRDLSGLIPVFRVLDDPREVGLTFFERCRDAIPRIPRSANRFEFRRPVVVARAQEPEHKWLLVVENLSAGGLFIRDPRLSCTPEELLQLRFPGLGEVPALLGRIRWVHTQRDRDSTPGYGCAFDSPSDPAVRRLLSGARALTQEAPEPPPARPGRPPGSRPPR
jgi:hypothetical protein